MDEDVRGTDGPPAEVSMRLRLSRREFGLAAGLACTNILSIAAQAPPTPSTSLSIAGDVATPLTLAPADLKSMPRAQVAIKDDDGRSVSYEGALLADILKKAGVPLGSAL